MYPQTIAARVMAFALALAALSPAVLTAAGREEVASPDAERYRSMAWEEIVAEADGQSVFFNMWGGSDAINAYVTDYIGGLLAERYNVTMEMVPVTDASVFVNRVLGESEAGLNADGSVDLMWINGENFRTLREADLLFGPYSDILPNFRYVDADGASVAFDFGYPVDNYESPYGSAKMVMIYDSARVAEPPATVAELLEWIRANPGRFAYPAPPDFTGSAFVRHIVYHVAGGPERLLGPFDQQVFDEVAAQTWALLNELEPFLWRAGETYPDSRARQIELFANGEIWFDMAYNPNEPANLVDQGRYPESTRSWVFDEGTIANTHFVAIPFNAPNVAAALVTANLLLSPEAQLEKARPSVWGDLPAVDVSRLPDEWRARFDSLPRPPQVVAPEVLSAAKLPELQADWLQAIESGWVANVLER